MIDGQDQVKRGLLWLGSATLAARVLDFGATVVVVSVLGKAQMGLATLAISACAILESISGLGVGSALVQAKDLSEHAQKVANETAEPIKGHFSNALNKAA